MVDVTELARKALLEVTPESTVGQPVGTVYEGDGVVSVQFSNRMPGYPGWRWTVSVAQVEGDEPTVLEVELLPGDGSLLAPEWVPWSERLAEYRAGHDDAEAESDEDDDESDEDDDESDEDDDESDEDDDEDADYEDADDDEADDDESDDDDAFGDEDEDDLEESDDDELDGVDVDAADEDDDEEPAPVRSRGARRRAARVRPVDPDDDLELDRLDPTEVDPDRHA